MLLMGLMGFILISKIKNMFRMKVHSRNILDHITVQKSISVLLLHQIERLMQCLLIGISTVILFYQLVILLDLLLDKVQALLLPMKYNTLFKLCINRVNFPVIPIFSNFTKSLVINLFYIAKKRYLK
jgi:hypothetical protein